MRLPDFVIVGAPKCGTTSLASYLGAHPGIFMPPLKEPNYFCFDLPKRRRIDQLDAYHGLFEPAGADQLCFEASAMYLFSDVAVPAVLDTKSDAKIIVMVRNPIEMVVSHHSSKLYTLEENERDFERAWRLSSQRAEGRMVTPQCRAPRYLDYQAIGRLGWQVQRLKRWVPEDQLHVIVFDDLRADPGAVYRDALGFLGIMPDDRHTFEVLNARQTHVWSGLSRLLKSPPRPVRLAKRVVRSALPRQTKALGRALRRANAKPAARQALSGELRQEMAATFRDDITLLGELIGRDLKHWHGAA